jgi:hypothetical protein
MKFVLVLKICSLLYSDCMPPVEKNIFFKTHYDCATYGYVLAKEMMTELGQDLVNNKQLVIGFKCKPILNT